MNRFSALLFGTLLFCPCLAGAENVRLTNDSGASTRPVVCIDASNDAVIVWEDDRDGNVELYYRRFSQFGIPLTPEVRLTNTGSKSALPDVSCDGLGNSYIVWQEGENVNGVGDVYYAALDQNGSFVVAPTFLHSLSGTARISTRPDGTSDIVYHRFTASDQYVYFVRMSPLGVSLCEPRPKLYAGTIPGFSKTPVVVALVHTAAIFWRDMNMSSQLGLWNGGVDLSCGAGTGMIVSNNNAIRPDAAGSPTEGLVWRVFEQSGYIRSYLGGGSSCAIAGTGSATQPRVASDGNRRFLTWQDSRSGNNDIYMCRYDEACPSETGDVQITNHAGESRRPDIATPQDGSGEWVIVWQDNHDGNWEVYMTGMEIRGSGALSGQVAELGGSPTLPGATVSLLQGEVVVATTTTGPDGVYLTPLVAAGTYDLRVEMPQYKTYEETGIEIQAGLPTVRNVQLAYDWQFEISIDPFGSELDPADYLNVKASIKNIDVRTADNMVVALFADGQQLGNAENIVSLLPGATYTFSRGKTVLRIWENKPVTCLVEHIDGLPVGISNQTIVSTYYPVGDDGNPFDVNLDAYSFSNRFLSLSEWSDYFASTQCDFGLGRNLIGLALGQIVPLCYGMAATSAIYFQDSSKKPVPQETFDMQETDEDVMNEIFYYHINQWTKLTKVMGPAFGSDPEEEKENIKDIMTKNKVPLIMLRTESLTNGYPHAVATYRLTEDLTNKTAKARVYENNYDGPLTDRMQTASFEFGEGNSFQYKGYVNLRAFEPPDLGVIRNVCEWMKEASSGLFLFYDGLGLNRLFQGCPAKALITDEFGRRIGFVDSLTFVNEIPGASVEYYSSSENDSAAFYYIPNGVDYAIEYFGMGDGYLESNILIPKGEGTAISNGHESVPVEAGMKFKIEISDTSDYYMDVDLDGDGSIDDRLPPDYSNVSPSAPKLVDPINDEIVTTQSPDFVWSNCYDLDGDSIVYEIMVSTDSSFQSVVLDSTVEDTLCHSARPLNYGNYFWRVIARDTKHLETPSLTTEGFDVQDPTGITTSRNTSRTPSITAFPSPSNAGVEFLVHVPAAASGEVKIYDVAGRLIKSMSFGKTEMNDFQLTWDGTNSQGQLVSTGVYFCQLVTRTKSVCGRFVILK